MTAANRKFRDRCDETKDEQKRFFGFKIEWRCGSGCQSLPDFPPSTLFQEDAGSHENAGEVGWELQTAIRLSLCYAISKHKHKRARFVLFPATLLI